MVLTTNNRSQKQVQNGTATVHTTLNRGFVVSCAAAKAKESCPHDGAEC